MNKFLPFALSVSTVLCGAAVPARAQTETHVTTANPMPDGSRDTYVGLGVQSAPRWEGAHDRKVSALPVLQVQWSNGFFISGMSAGLHLSDGPTVEYGPLLALLPGRGASGTGTSAGGVGSASSGPTMLGPVFAPDLRAGAARGEGLAGLDDIHARLVAGGFVNYYLSPAWRLTGSLLYGAGNGRDGARLELGAQRLAAGLGAHHRVSLSAGIGIVNRAYAQAYFGVAPEEALTSRFAAYRAGGGLQDVRAGLRWNWDWTPSWMLTTNLQARRLLGSARHSPLAERTTNLTVSTAVAYRF